MPTDLVVRLATHRDAPAFRALNRQTFHDSIPDDERMDRAAFLKHYDDLYRRFAPFDSPRNSVWIAEVAGQYAGHCWLGLQTDFFTGRDQPWIFDVSVVAKYRRNGIGKALIQEAVTAMRDKGHTKIGLQVFAHNIPALELYQALGFTVRSSVLSFKL